MSGTVFLILRLVLLACLYGFLGWAIYTIWKDLRAQENQITAPKIPGLALTPVGGDPDADEQIYQQPEVVLGRSTTNEFSIADETVSSRHARLSYHHKQWWIEDLNSTNGTFLNDERVGVPTVIVPGDELRVGNVIFIIGIGDKEAK